MTTPPPPAATDAPLPVERVLPALRAALDTAGRAVLAAPPGAGKTTRVPLDLLSHGAPGRTVLLEPRRVAARAAAERLAAALGERPGATIGLTTRDDRRTSRATRIEVVTEGVLLRRLQRDPTLPGVGTLMFDEFHERSLDADLALAFALDARAALRGDLRLLVTSATLEVGRVAALLDDAPVITAEGRSHPVEVVHGERPADLVAGVVDAVHDALADEDGDVLVFLPGAAEIDRTRRALTASVDPDVEVLRLHGRLPPAEQDRAIAPARPGTRKVVLATDLAESSITIDGVRTVIDAGLVREPRFDAATAMTGLVTRPASQASAAQRAGRAGRTAPGRCLRLWPAREHPTRDPHPRPAIATDDLTGAALEVAAWGGDVADLALLDQPPSAGWARARDTLAALGALDDGGRITAHGRELAALPTHPRLGQVLLRGRDLGDGGLACEIAAVLGDRDVLVTSREAPYADVVTRVEILRGAPPPGAVTVRAGALRAAGRDARRLARHLDVALTPAGDAEHSGRLLAVGWPERVAAARGSRRGAFVLAGGRGATLPDGDALAGEPLLAVAHLDRGAQEARIHLAAVVDAADLRRVLADQVTIDLEIGWQDGDVRAERCERLGAVVLHAEPLHHPPPDAVLHALLDGLRAEGLDLLATSDAARQLQARIGLLRATFGEAWPDVSDAALLADLDEAVGPFLLRARRRADLARVALADVVHARLAPGQGRTLERLAPTHLTVPSGSRIRLDYLAGDRPVLAVRVQEVFGAASTPTVADGRVAVLVHLLSPAGRPVQVTDDLAGFWDRAYPAVRSELRGRYPKHAWPDDPRRALPLRGTRRRR